MGVSHNTAEPADSLVRQLRERLAVEGTVEKQELLFQTGVLLSDIREMMAMSYGPCGMNKLVCGPAGDIYMTGDGKTIIKEMDVLHPAAVVMKRLGQGMNKVCGDGTKTAVMMACSLLLRALPLLNKKIHPAVIIRGYEKAMAKTCEMLDYISEDATPEMMLSAVRAAAFSKGLTDAQADRLSQVLFQTVFEWPKETAFDPCRSVRILKRTGSPEIVPLNGVILDEQPVRGDMPRCLGKPRVLLIRGDVKVTSAYLNPKHFVRAASPEKMMSLKEARTSAALEYAGKIIQTGATLVFCEGEMDPVAEAALARKNIMVYTRLKVKDMEYLSRATNAGFVQIHDSKEDMARCLGRADRVFVQKKRYDTFSFIEADGPVISFLINEPMTYGLEKIEEAADDALNTAAFLLKYPKVVTGAGGTEYFLARSLRIYAVTLSGKEQLAVMEFANAVEDIAKTLAKNVGMDAIDAISELSARQSEGIDARLDISRHVVGNHPSVYDCAAIRKTALISAAETAISLLRVDGLFLRNNRRDMADDN